MTQPKMTTMRAVVIDAFGGVDKLEPREIPVPELAPNEVLLRVEAAGVGEWDPFEREGGYAEMISPAPTFPYVLGSEGAGTVAAVGEQVRAFAMGERVYGVGFLNPKGGFYAEYVALDAGLVARIPGRLTTEQVAVMPGVATTALRGLDDTLALRPGQTLLVLGAGGGVGHVAVQLAKRMGARVLAVASGGDGVALAQRLGADLAINGRSDDIAAAARRFAPGGLDAALLTAGGAAAEQAIAATREGGHIAYPAGIQPEPAGRSGVRLSAYYGAPDAELVARLTRIVERGPFEVHVARTFPLEQAADAHRALEQHYLGKLALSVA